MRRKGGMVGLTIIIAVLAVVSAAIAYIIWKQAQNSSAPRPKVREPRSSTTDDSGQKVAAKAAKRGAAKGLGRATVKRRGKHPAPPINPYRATSIKPGRYACEAVLALDQARFLVTGEQIPAIPVPGCKSFNCTCKYVKHNDRRNGMEGDRRALGGLRRDLMSQAQDSERRTVRRGRRSDD